MNRFGCKDRLILKPCLRDRTLNIKTRYLYHTPYTDFHLSPQILNFIYVRVATQTPPEIYQNLQASSIPDVERIIQSQILYQLHQLIKKNWRRNDNQFLSVVNLLEEKCGEYTHNVFIISGPESWEFTLIHLFLLLYEKPRKPQ